MRKLVVVGVMGLLAGCAVADTTAQFELPGGIKVSIAEGVFLATKVKVIGCAVGGGAGCLIDGQIPFGIVRGLPKTYVKSISIVALGKSYPLDVSGMYDAWGKRPLEYPGAVRYFGGWCFDERNCQFRGLFSDGASTFVAEWRVVQGRGMRTVLTDSSDVVDLFMSHIDPPRFVD